LFLSFKFRLLPTRQQHAALARILEDQRILYNAALEERIGCYRATGKTRTYIDQCKALTEWRGMDEEAAANPVKLQRWTLKRVNDAFDLFFRRAKARSRKVGFPRFRGKGWWRSFGFAEFMGVGFDGKRLRWQGMPGGLRVHLHRALPAGKILSCIFTRDGRGWHVCFQMRVEAGERRTPSTAVGIDLGLTYLAALSNGEVVPNPRHAKRAERELRRRQRAVVRCKRGSNRRRKAHDRVAALHRKITDTRSTYLHQVSASIVGRFDVIAIERLNVKGLAGGMLAGPIHDASWARLRDMLNYKAERAGVALIEVDSRNTSQACSGCGVIVKKDLSVRVHECADCGLVLDRDHNAALNILRRGVAALGALNAPVAAHALGNIGESRDATYGER
jgi:putative transposase